VKKISSYSHFHILNFQNFDEVKESALVEVIVRGFYPFEFPSNFVILFATGSLSSWNLKEIPISVGATANEAARGSLPTGKQWISDRPTSNIGNIRLKRSK
jgi:hypothetical protein